MADFSIEPVSEDALLLRFGTGVDAGTNARVQAAARALRAANIAGLIDIAPAYATLLLRFATVSDMAEMGSGSFSAATVLHGVDAEGNEPDPTSVESENESGPTSAVDIPVCYGGDYGADLAAVAAHARLDPEAVVARHTATPYKVAMLGFAPGFPYLLGLDPALQVPRRASPRTRVPAGSVAIGGAQTGIYPRELPGGWQLIGRTPLTLFAPARDPPSLLAPGDRVRFHAIDADTFTRLAERRA